MKPLILIVDDDSSIRDTLRMVLEYEGFSVLEAESGQTALRLVKDRTPSAVLMDIKMGGMDGMESLERIHACDPRIPVIMLTGHGTVDTAAEAARKGAFDFFTKPPDAEKIVIALRNAVRQHELLRENQAMREETAVGAAIIGQSSVVRDLLVAITRVAPVESTVLITGENGSGKELVAQALHAASPRREAPFVEINCAAIPTELIESELFGHERGSFTGAVTQRIGRFEQAHGGTLFLDEIGDMSLTAQAKVLRVLEEGAIQRVGGTKAIPVDVRIVAATNKKLLDEMKEGRFREDLYHRLNVIPLQVPSLRERREDIPLLVLHFLKESCRRNKLPSRAITEDAITELRRLQWPGNVRELRNAVERLAILGGDPIDAGAVRRLVVGREDPVASLLDEELTFQEYKDRAEALYIRRRLEQFDWNISRTAEALDIQRSHLYTKMKRYGLMRTLDEDRIQS